MRQHAGGGSSTTTVAGGPRAVLVIDDDLAVCEVFTSALRQAGFAVDARTSGQEALALARVRSFGVAVVDLQLPDVPGLELIRVLRR